VPIVSRTEPVGQEVDGGNHLDALSRTIDDAEVQRARVIPTKHDAPRQQAQHERASFTG